MGSSTKKAAKKPAIKFPRVIVTIERHTELSKMARANGVHIADIMEGILEEAFKK